MRALKARIQKYGDKKITKFYKINFTACENAPDSIVRSLRAKKIYTNLYQFVQLAISLKTSNFFFLLAILMRNMTQTIWSDFEGEEVLGAG